MRIGSRVKIVNAKVKEFNGAVGTIIKQDAYSYQSDDARWWVRLDTPVVFRHSGVNLPVDWYDFSLSEMVLIP